MEGGEERVVEEGKWEMKIVGWGKGREGRLMLVVLGVEESGGGEEDERGGRWGGKKEGGRERRER